MNIKALLKTNFPYTALFCEENIWQLINSLSHHHGINMNTLWCLFISNPAKKALLFNQQIAPENQPTIWDYHVVLLAQFQQQWLIFDFDTRLGFITPLTHYLSQTFTLSNELPQEFIPYIKKIPAQVYWQSFYSDRSHMLGQIKESDYPTWPIINKQQKNPLLFTDLLDYSISDYSISKNINKKDTFALIKTDSLTSTLQALRSTQ